jgi:hypothetical protein
MDRYVSAQPLEVPAAVNLDEMSRADLVFYGVEHGGPSYEALIFIDNPEADADTPLDAGHGYAGSYTVFGHAGCFGEEGHCEPADRFTDEFDHRGPHPLTPWTRTVIVTDALKAAVRSKDLDEGNAAVTVTVVPVVTEVEHPVEHMPDAFHFSELRLLTYEED